MIEKIGNNSLKCKIEKNKDRYKRLIGECFIKKESLSIFMVRNGYAFDWPHYSKGKFAKRSRICKEEQVRVLEHGSLINLPWIWKKKVREKK